MNAPTAAGYDSLLDKFDLLDETIKRTVKRTQRRAFWIGWAIGTATTWIGWWLA